MRWVKYKQLIENFFSLSVLNALNVLLPLVTLPYMLHVVGKANYGAYSYIYAIVQYVILFSTYGFNFSATKQISQCRDDKEAVSRIYNAVTASKALIAVFLSVGLLLCGKFVFKDGIGTLMFVYGLGMVIGDVLTPIWLFQGMEKMKYMTIVNASSKILFTILIFIVVRERDDYQLLISLNSSGYLLAGVLSLILVHRQFHLRLHFV
jgi:PST family polysaccharide transporter